nr:MAG TPA: hypothetical protein [Caudoviricetes sp.]
MLPNFFLFISRPTFICKLNLILHCKKLKVLWQRHITEQ